MTATATSGAPTPARTRRPSRQRTYTPEQFLALENDDGAGFLYELNADGRLEKRKMGARSESVSAAFVAALHQFARGRGTAMGGGVGLQIFVGRPLRIPRADAIFISRERLPELPAGHLQVAPELLVEVVSRGDNAGELERKVQEYLSAGVLRVWVAYPDEKTITIRRPDGSSSILGIGETITGEDAAPGFTAAVASLFPE
jgi:Uma2 family endonuclease